MSKGRKTTSVEALRDFANTQLRRDDEFATQKFKAGICSMVEHALMRANRYDGWNNIRWLSSGFTDWIADDSPEDKEPYMGAEYDRVYYIKSI